MKIETFKGENIGFGLGYNLENKEVGILIFIWVILITFKTK